MAWLLASWSRFLFSVLHKETSGPWDAADDDDNDDRRTTKLPEGAFALSLSYSVSSTVMVSPLRSRKKKYR